MKVLQLGKFYPIRGGVEKVMWTLAEGLGERGVDIDMLCAFLPGTEFPGDRTRVCKSGVRIITLNDKARCICVPAVMKLAATMISPAMIFYLRRHAGEYDIIHVHHPDPMAALALWLSGYKGRVLVHWHSDILKQSTLLKFYMPLQNWMLDRAEKVIGTTPVYIASSEHLKNVQDKCCFVPIGINKISPIAKNILNLRGLYQDRKLIFSLGRLVEYKGFCFLVDAARFLPEEYLIVIAGQGPLKEELEAQARQMKAMAARKGEKCAELRFVGYQTDDEAWAWMAAADCFVLPSIMKTEAFGIVQLEAMSVGTPVVATEIPGSGTSWVNADGESGANVPVEDSRAIAGAIQAVAGNAGIRERYSKGALQRFERMFTLEKMIDNIFEIYTKN